MAQDIHGLVKSLGFDNATIVGHDVGMMVAYAYAAQYPDETDHVVLMDAFLSGIGNWKDTWHSIREVDRQIYAAAHARPGSMRAGFEYFRNFEQDALDFQQFAQNKLTMPVRVFAGEKAGGIFLLDQVRLVANDAQGEVIHGSGHWLLEEAPGKVIPVLTEYIH